MDFPGHFQHIFQQLNHQRLHAQLCDCVVMVGGQSFQAHRSILAACSSHFRALLSSSDSTDEGGSPAADKCGSGTPSVMELDPEVVTPEAFSTLLDMIYTSTLSLGCSNVMDVLLAASHLHLNTVVKACKLHLSRKNFPASPPKGWREVQHQQCPSSHKRPEMLPQVSSALVEDVDDEVAVVEVSQSGGAGDEGARRRAIGEQSTEPSFRHKRKSQEEWLSGRKRACKLSGDVYKECSPTVSRSALSTQEGAEELLSPDSWKMPDKLWDSQGDEDEVEEKYEAAKGDSEEIQLPSQSDSSTGRMGKWEKEDKNGDAVVKVKVGEGGEEEGEESNMAMIEVKKENLSSYSPEMDPVPNDSPPYFPQDSPSHLDAPLNDVKMNTHSPSVADVGALQHELCTDLQANAEKENEDMGDDAVGGDGLDSLSELAFSCFLNPTAEGVVMGALEEEDSLASLTAAAAAAAAASDAPATLGNVSELCQNPDDTNTSSAHSSESSSSLVFPVASVPLQQLLPSQASGFSDTLILQPAQNSFGGFLSSIRPGLSLEASLIQPSNTGKNRGGSSGPTTFRRIAPKVPPGSDASADPSSSSGSGGDAAERLPLTRASEDVLSKCKKAAAEDHVLLVEGEKKYACKICCKTFMNLTDCKKHIRIHTGEKPYPCPKCGKRFSQSSHLYKHSKNTCLNWKDDQAFPDTLLT